MFPQLLSTLIAVSWSAFSSDFPFTVTILSLILKGEKRRKFAYLDVKWCDTFRKVTKQDPDRNRKKTQQNKPIIENRNMLESKLASVQAEPDI